MQTMVEALNASAPLEKVALETYVPPAKPSLVGLSRAEIAEGLGAVGVAMAQRKMRVQQLWHWIYVRGASNFDEMTSISKEMRTQLDQHFTVARPEVVAEQISNDGTRKWLLRLPSGDSLEKAHEVECVYIPETDRGTLCVSSQVGCTLNCSFCHTGTQRLVRNLTAGEIVGQVMVARDRLNDWADRGIVAGRPRLSRRVERPPHHLRICDAQGCQRFARRCKTAGENAQGHPRQDQPDPVQSLARHSL